MLPGKWMALQRTIASKIGVRDSEVSVARPVRSDDAGVSGTVQVPFYVQGASICAILDQQPDHTATHIHRGLRLLRLGLLKPYWQQWRLAARRLTERRQSESNAKQLKDGLELICLIPGV